MFLYLIYLLTDKNRRKIVFGEKRNVYFLNTKIYRIQWKLEIVELWNILMKMQLRKFLYWWVIVCNKTGCVTDIWIPRWDCWPWRNVVWILLCPGGVIGFYTQSWAPAAWFALSRHRVIDAHAKKTMLDAVTGIFKMTLSFCAILYHYVCMLCGREYSIYLYLVW